VRRILLEKIVLPLGDILLRTSFIKKLKKWRSYKDMTTDELMNIQRESLKNHLEFVVKHVEEYKDIKLEGNTPEEWLTNFPILTKENLRSNPNKYLIREAKINELTKVYSSGSTGVSTYVYMSKEDLSSNIAISRHLWELCGYQIASKTIQTGISPDRTGFKKLKDIFFNTLYIESFSLKEKDLNDICSTIKDRHVKTIIGYSATINFISEYVIEHNIDLKIDLVICLGDKLFPVYRKNIEKAFKTTVKETYGSSEGFQIGFQADLDYMYIYTPQVYLEILDEDNNPVKNGEVGNVVVTSLDNKTMPLIRYKLGDLASLLPIEEYPEKRKYNFPLLKKVIGRDTDIVLLPDNSKLMVHSFTGIFEYESTIKQFKVIQKSINSMMIEIVVEPNFHDDRLKIIRNKLGSIIKCPRFEITFQKVNQISRSKLGKTQIIESFIK